MLHRPGVLVRSKYSFRLWNLELSGYIGLTLGSDTRTNTASIRETHRLRGVTLARNDVVLKPSRSLVLFLFVGSVRVTRQRRGGMVRRNFARQTSLPRQAFRVFCQCVFSGPRSVVRVIYRVGPLIVRNSHFRMASLLGNEIELDTFNSLRSACFRPGLSLTGPDGKCGEDSLRL